MKNQNHPPKTNSKANPKACKSGGLDAQLQALWSSRVRTGQSCRGNGVASSSPWRYCGLSQKKRRPVKRLQAELQLEKNVVLWDACRQGGWARAEAVKT